MQDVDRFGILGEVHHAVDSARVPDTNLLGPGTDIVERLPVGGFKPGLDLCQLEARFLPSVFRKCQEIVVGGSHPTDLFLMVHSGGVYTILYTTAEWVKALISQLISLL